MQKLAFLTILAFFPNPALSFDLSCVNARMGGFNYEANRAVTLKATKELKNFRSRQGIEVLERHQDGSPKRAKIRVLVDNADAKVGVIGDFNNWNRQNPLALKPVEGGLYFEGEIAGITHGMKYRLVLNGRELIDPAANFFAPATEQNSMFYDFGFERRVGAHKLRHKIPDLRRKPLVIAEAELFHLVEKWVGPNGERLTDISQTYEFIANSGVIQDLKDRGGYNAIEFLPFNASLGPNNWQFRYQVFGAFAPDGRYGTPDAFARMVDKFNESKVLVIMDAVAGHFPYKGEVAETGLHHWTKKDGKPLFRGVDSPWTTYRYDYTNPHVRRFLIDSILTMMRQYGIGGVRFDNLDGIRFEKGGWEFLQELAKEIRAYQPETILIGEMFFGENMVTASPEEGGLGINYRTNKDFFDFIKDNMLKPTEQINMWTLKAALRDPFGWREAARNNYITNHDEAGNPRDGATGQFPASLIGTSGTFKYAQRKTMTFSALAMLSGSAYIDLPQARLGQEGSFSNNTSVDWGLRNQPERAALDRFLGDLSKYYGNESAYAFENQHPNMEHFVDHTNKVIVFKHKNFDTGKTIYSVINLGHKAMDNYSFGISEKGNFRLVIDSDSSRYQGSGLMEQRLNGGNLAAGDTGMHGWTSQLNLPHLGGYGVAVLESIH